MLERLSTRAKNALIAAQLISEQLKHDHIGSEHLLYGIISERSSFASEILLKNNISLAVIKDELEKVNQNHITGAWKPILSENIKNAIERAAIIATRYQYQFIGTEHFLYGILDIPQNRAKVIMSKLGVNMDQLKRNLVSVFESIEKFPSMIEENGGIGGGAPGAGNGLGGLNMNGAAGGGSAANGPASGRQDFGFQPGPEMDPQRGGVRTSALEYFTTDLTKRAAQGKIDPVIGRKREIDRMISILNRRTKNNPVLIGEPGVGKTAIVEGLALAIVKREVPDSLLDKKILALDLALIVAGSMFRGEFESRLKQIIDEIRDNPKIILFIDELHTVVGAGATTGSLDAANILKPALARGELHAIGATTLGEYKKHIEHDAALERRFQPILVGEPSEEEAIDILKGLRANYEKHHKITITDEAIKAAVEMSTRYIQDRYLPDKAVDLIDETAAYLKTVGMNSKALRTIKKLESELEVLEDEKTKAILSQDFATADHLRVQGDKLVRQISELKKSVDAQSQEKEKQQISPADIARTVATMTGIPLNKLIKTEAVKLVNLEELLHEKIIGQDEAVKVIAKSIRRSRAGVASPKRPLGSFIFLGPSGVGKTETAKVLAREVFEDEDALIRVDMSEFMEKHNVARLIGAPAGYVGYEEGGRLTESVRRKPYSVILFDEMEKAHPDVFNILLQILEEGELTDASGRRINFRNTIVIMTSNIGLGELNRQAVKIGFEEQAEKKQQSGATAAERKQSAAERKAQTERAMAEYEKIKDNVLASLREQYRPEFLNRIDKVVVFKPLGYEEIKKIAALQINELAAHLKKQNIMLQTTASGIKFIADKSFDPSQGARLVRRNIQDYIEDPLAEKLITGQLKEGSSIKLSDILKKVK
ncbi:ATP-dependent Clp protease ATP-binding subunit [Patescibacteria group bacterium]|nr:ATP-dependent Clp protease ATP-binding subunit [Patescibacteria group bacterium]